MDKITLTFSAEEQALTSAVCPYRFASNTVSYIEAVFELGENWTGYDSVRAVWHSDFQTISTVLDGDNTCVVPTEVLTRTGKVSMNLVGSIVDDDEVTDRLTTYPVVALIVDAKARISGTETTAITASQFEQFVAQVENAVAQIKDIESVVLNDDYTLTINFSDGTSTTTTSIRGAQGEQGIQGEQGVQGETGNGIASVAKTGTSGLVDTYTITFTDGTTTTFEVTNGQDGEVTLDTLRTVLPQETASGDIASFTDGTNLVSADSVVANIDAVQSGSGDPSPNNICPISGWSEVDVTACGKNLLDTTVWVEDHYIDANGNTGSETGTHYTQNYSPIKAGTYRISVPRASNKQVRVRLHGYDDSMQWVKQVWTESLNAGSTIYDTSVTVDTGIKYLRVSVTSEVSDILLEVGSTATTYEAYTGTTYTTSLGSTYYGGYVDIVSGVLTVTHGVATLNGSSSGVYFTSVSAETTADGTAYVGFINCAAQGIKGGASAMCDTYGWVDAPLSNISAGQFNSRGSYLRFVLHDQTITTLADWNTYLSSNPMELVYELATPTTIQLTPQDIDILLGNNNIYADSGSVVVTYRADIQKYIEKKLAE